MSSVNYLCFRFHLFLWLFNYYVVETSCTSLVLKHLPDDSFNLTCVTNDSSALSWISNDKLPGSDGVLPYDIIFKFNLAEKHIHTDVRNSLTFNETGKRIPMVFDYRWDNFPTKDGERGRYSEVLLNTNITTLYISLRYKSPVNLKLCSKSVCYSAIVNSSMNSKILFKPNSNESEEENVANVDTAESYIQYSWQHYAIYQLEQTFYLQKYINGFEDYNASMFELEEFSLQGDVSWKIQDYNFLYVNYFNGSGVKLISDVENAYIVCMFLVFCKTCTLEVTIFDGDDKISQETINGTDEWSEEKFYLKNPYSNSFYFKMLNEQPSRLLIGNVRRCGQNDVYHKSYFNQPIQTKCQVISDMPSIIQFRNVTEHCENCPETSKCPIFEESYCEKSIICNEHSCVCFPGYTGTYCNEQCEGGTWGDGCKKNCSEGCKNRECNHITGECVKSDCLLGYSGKQCLENFTWNVERGTNELILSSNLSNYEIRKLKGDQYNKTKSNNGTHFRFHNLKPLQVYSFRLFMKPNVSEDTETLISTKNVTTKCEAITRDFLKIESTNKSVTLYSLTNTSCPLIQYEILNKNYSIKKGVNGSVQITNLAPFTNYSIEMKTNISDTDLIGNHTVLLTFATDSGIPKVEVQQIDATNISITLKISSTINGVFKKYSISYKPLQNTNCKKIYPTNSSLRMETISEMKTQYTLENLNPSTKYEVRIYVENDKHTGTDSNTFQTLDSEYLSQEELQLICLPNKTGIFFEMPKCEDMKGKVFYRITLIRESGNSSIKSGAYQEGTMGIKYASLNLPPFQSYNLSMFARKSDKFEPTSPPHCSFKTPPGIPSKVANFETYSSSNDSIDLRWKPPQPITGDVESYKITYYNLENQTESGTIEKYENCMLWDDYICAELKPLSYNTSFKLKIQAKNKDVDSLGELVDTTARTQESAATAPENVSISYKNHSALLSWNHPNKTNGRISQFLITYKNEMFESVVTQFYNINTIYRKTYSAQVEKKLKPSTTYNVTIQAINSHKGNASKVVRLDTFPPVPVFNNKVTYSSCDGHSKCLLHLPSVKYLNAESVLYVVLTHKDTNKLNHSNPEEQTILKNLSLHEDTHYIRMIQRNQLARDLNGATINLKEDVDSTIDFSEFEVKVLIINKYHDLNTYSALMDVHGVDGSRLSGFVTFLVVAIVLLVVILLTLGLLWKKYGLSLGTFCKQAVDIKENDTLIPLIETFGDKGEFLKNILRNKRFVDEEYKGIKEHSEQTCREGLKTENSQKNRYKNIIPYDAYRVVLEQEPNYINASYINGYNGPHTYIATQCPNENTCYDFWRMVVQANTKVIVCLATLTEGKKKMTRYWPTKNKTMDFTDISVVFEQSFHETDYIKRVFVVSDSGFSNRRVYQMQYISWPDHSIPLHPLSFLQFIKCVKQANDVANSYRPVIVHCSAGIGRTGTYIMCDHLLEQTKDIMRDVPGYLNEIRMYRKCLVSKPIQYKFIYFILDEHFNGCNRQILQKNLRIVDARSNIKAHFSDAKNRRYAYEFLYDTISFQVEKQTDPMTYFDALNVHGYEKNKGFIVCKTPKDTDTEFWEMIYQENIRFIISMKKINVKNVNHDARWRLGQLIPTTDFLQIAVNSVTSDNNCVYYELHLFHCKNQDEWTITWTQCYLPWEESACVPTDDLPLHNLYNEYLESVKDTPTVLTCWDGVTGCGLFIAVDLTIQKLKNDYVLDMYWLVTALEQYQKHSTFVYSEQQLEFIYQMIIKHYLIENDDESEPLYGNTILASELYQNLS